MKRIIESGLVRDAGIFAGAALGIHLAFGFKKAPSHPLLDVKKYPLVCRSGFLAPMVSLAKFCDPTEFDKIAVDLNAFLSLVQENNPTKHGFEINRLASSLPMEVAAVVRRMSYDKRLDVAVKAMDFERDELKVVHSVCNNIVRNMLLDARPYA